MAKKEFQAESKKLMDMMINSIYTNKEIFLRELISNASDAIDKLYYKSLTDPSVGMNKGDFRILLTRDKDNRLLTVSDNGIGMTKEELEQNLGTIAHSGSLDFKKDNKDENIDIIGQFGVGFYSAFMVADKVTVISKAYGADEAWQWESSGADGYELTPRRETKPPVPTSSCTSRTAPIPTITRTSSMNTALWPSSKSQRLCALSHPDGTRKEPPEAGTGPQARGLQARVGDLHRAGDPEQHDPHLEEAEERGHR